MKKYIFLLLIILLASASIFAQTKETRNVSGFTKVSFRVPGKFYLRQGSTIKVEIEGKKDLLDEIETKLEGNKLVIGKEGKWSNWHWEDDDNVNVYITMPTIEGLSVGGSGDLIAETRIKSQDLDLNVSGSGSMRIEVEVAGALEADVSGSGDVVVKGKCKSFNSDVSGSGKVSLALAIENLADFGISGSGKIEASGSANAVKTSISGSGKVLAAELVTNTCDVRISGSGDVEINVTEALDANISGSGSVSYKGEPKRLNSHSSGSGKVRKI
ncbi:head GIN domain-containing protein [Ohtaekwangia koreensis]|uniref:Putative auto-transporter adhesin, head GIN domain n=1 Tax=Ohtaekwangia koreensis TaxID=688867 RepID=A0A1T5IZN3_9BACT|nr:head GIN domain-containing protein [Ohtaekwangia koreensis]SKC44657.1 Putative auto-transporter adhesin, head GIN domain [Ohtaekwangia koreensis]